MKQLKIYKDADGNFEVWSYYLQYGEIMKDDFLFTGNLANCYAFVKSIQEDLLCI